MKLETKNGVRTITLSKREKKSLTDAEVVLRDLLSIGEQATSLCLTELEAIIGQFCEPAKSAT